ncbi:DUF3300 domain-containing protein [Rhodanobacter sp. MP7CTX1]|uniref:DUF3300 domain-containing protein n=1 Tax=Rhodanobacter sp. MP7CTX1 TaxID=2723084 RepID=UPI0016187A91|nr:DUF3300 domain-containing protein [Rhodanobacter sp. MP7CTX1]MBB6186343.1 hypothetical protein [Rhodanobacter sp. MP7CTX1]
MPASSAPAPAGSAAQAAAPYTPPTADQLYQLVAPIALFPDNLVAQVLAGATYPDQITAADSLLAQSPNLKGVPLQTAIAPQPWDPSVKGLTAFPSVLSQMAQNIQWTTSLGEAYVNDPTDVMNAIQVMRQRAAKHGNLRDSAQQRVVTQPVTAVDTTAYTDNGDNGEPPVYNGPSVVQEPDQAIQIMPADPDTVYVPSYNPQTVYGEEVPVYPGYAYVQPAGYSTGDLIAVGAVTFGAAILVGSLFNHHDHYNNGPAYGWNNWGMHWGPGHGNGGGWQRPAVVYNNSTYVSRSTTVVNRYTTNNYNNRTVNNNIVRNPAVANRNNFNNPGNPGNPGNRNFNNPGNAAANRAVVNTPQAMRSRPGEAPASRPMSVPTFGTPVRGAEPVRNGQAGARPGRPAPTQGAAQPTVPTRGAELPRSGSAAGTTRDQVRTPGQANPSTGRRPTAQSPVTPQPTNRAAQQGMTRPSAPNNFNRPQPERTPPASRPAAQTQETPRPAATRPQPAQRPQATQERPQPAQQRPQPVQQRPQPEQQRPQPVQQRPQPEQQRPQPAQQRPQPAQPRPQAEQRPQPAAQQRPEPARAPARPEKKNDKDNGH